MNTPRIIPVLLLKGLGLYKGIKFKDHKYLGDPLNAVKIFNDKEADELILLDIGATVESRIPQLDLIRGIADECYMPFAVGGGIRTVKQAKAIFDSGAEKIVINTAAMEMPELISEISGIYGSQSVVVSIDASENLLGSYSVYIRSGTVKTKWDPVKWAKHVEKLGAGEIMLTSIDKDGTMSGYDLNLIKLVSNAVDIPVIACGGAGKTEDFSLALKDGASAVAAGAKFVFHGKHRAVLITYP